MPLYRADVRVTGHDYSKVFRCVARFSEHLCSKEESDCAGRGWRVIAVGSCLVTIGAEYGHSFPSTRQHASLQLFPGVEVTLQCGEPRDVVKVIKAIAAFFEEESECKGLGLSISA